MGDLPTWESVCPNNLSDIEIANSAEIRPIGEIAAKLDIPADALINYGNTKAKIGQDYIDGLPEQPNSKLILVTAISPTPAGEGKTTTSIGLADGMNLIGKRVGLALREPSLGPCFGMKGGAAGGGYAQIVPMDDINLHFTGDFHAISAAHNLLAALVDNHLHWTNELKLDPRRITWRRVLDMNDRALRQLCVGLGGPANGLAREAGFDITPASEVMAIFCLATDLEDLERRLGNITIGYRRDGSPVFAREVDAAGAMTVLLRDAFVPNLVQTLEHNPVLVHGGPFGNIAHGCSSRVSVRAALKMSDYVVTEAGFGADLGAQKFFDIMCRGTELKPDVAVMVATIRALKMHGGITRSELEREDVDALHRGCANLARHRAQCQSVRCANRRGDQSIRCPTPMPKSRRCMPSANDSVSRPWNAGTSATGGVGAEDLARSVVEIADAGQSQFRTLYPDDVSLWDKIETVARSIYGAEEIMADKKIRDKIRRFDEEFGHLPVCIAKTQYSFSSDPNLLGAPSHHALTVRDAVMSSGAEFLVVLCGDIMTMPGLPRVPNASRIRLGGDRQIEGLF